MGYLYILYLRKYVESGGNDIDILHRNKPIIKQKCPN